MTKIEIDMLIAILTSIINGVIAANPSLAENTIIIDIQTAIAGLQALGI